MGMTEFHDHNHPIFHCYYTHMYILDIYVDWGNTEVLLLQQEKENKYLKDSEQMKDQTQHEQLVKTVIGKVESVRPNYPVYTKCNECNTFACVLLNQGSWEC